MTEPEEVVQPETTVESDLSLEAALGAEESNDTIETPEVKAEPEATTEEAAGVKESDSTPEPDKEATAEEQEWTKSAVLDERRKRQKAEERLDEFEREHKQAAAKELDESRPDVFEDQKGAFEHLEDKFAKALLATTIKLSRSAMQRAVTDYPEMEKVFVELAKEDPRLIEDMNQSSSPAEFAYDTAVKHLKYEQLQEGDPEKLRAKLKEEVRQELLKEAETNEKAESDLDDAIEQPSLATATAAGAEQEPDDSLDNVIGA